MANYMRFVTEDGDSFLVQVSSADVETTGEVTGREREISVLGRFEEVADTVKETVSVKFDDALGIIKSNATTFIRKIKELKDQPDEVQIIFGLAATGEFNVPFAIKAGLGASYTVCLIYKRNSTELSTPIPISQAGSQLDLG